MHEDIQHCKYCGAPIRFIHTEKGKWMPVDVGLIWYWKAPAGRSVLINAKGKTFRCALEGPFEERVGAAYRPHILTCPNRPAPDSQKRLTPPPCA